MADLFNRLNEDIAFVQKLGDNPNSQNGLTAQELKKWFDRAPLAIQTYLNSVFIPQVEAKFGSVDAWISQADKRFDRFIAGAGFLPVDGSAGMNANLPMNNHRITKVSNPEESTDAANKDYVDQVRIVANTATEKAETAQATAESKCSKQVLPLTLRTAGWSGVYQTVSAEGVSENNDVFVSPVEESRQTYLDCEVRCIEQGSNTLTFICSEKPENDLTVSVLIID